MILTALHIAIWVLEGIGVLIIVAATAVSLVQLGKAVLDGAINEGVERVRLEFAQRLVLALEFLIAADILATVHTPTLEGVGLLGAIITIRTVLSLSITYELRVAGGSREAGSSSRPPSG
jgi:uncharacterized membrane protein